MIIGGFSNLTALHFHGKRSLPFCLLGVWNTILLTFADIFAVFAVSTVRVIVRQSRLLDRPFQCRVLRTVSRGIKYLYFSLFWRFRAYGWRVDFGTEGEFDHQQYYMERESCNLHVLFTVIIL